MQQFQHDITMADRIMTSGYKFDDYYKRTDDSPEGFKPVQVLEMEEDLSAYEAYKKQIYQQSSSHDEFDRFIEGPPLPIGASSALSWWLEPTQQTSYPHLHRLAANIFSISAMSAEAERVFSGARRTITWDRSRLSVKTIEYTECLKHWIKNGLLDQAFKTPEAVGVH
ncbi:L-2-aminoadipate reductase large subunit [Fusarium oxysporum f. sp. albedinis]|nr:L-2-aminoadipate reductase large subunit [Fusarium oxysporum f. sp. albedinis]